MAKRIVVANWKMNLGPSEASLLVHRLDDKIAADAGVQVVLCPPFIDLYPMAREVDHKKFKLGAQNIHYLDEGPYTGEISPAMLKGLAEFAIIGHSERRRYFGEDDKLVGQKVAAALRHDITPVLCVGESLVDREHGAARKMVISQLEAGLSGVTAEDVDQVVVTYEPVWAISQGDGHGKFATPDEVKPMVTAIRQTIEDLYGETAAGKLKVLYGGSVNPDDCKAYLQLDGIDGLLVGGASLHYEQFAAIVKAAQDTA